MGNEEQQQRGLASRQMDATQPPASTGGEPKRLSQ
jgi:hypothetical protein